MNQFKKVSFEIYKDNIGGDVNLRQEYDDIKLPKRATKYSAGYDFYSPCSFTLEPGESIKIPTGIRVQLDTDKVLLIVPRSGLGFKYKLNLWNDVGVIDADYYNSDNEGHIFMKMINDNNECKTLSIKKGEAIAQGIIVTYSVTGDDAADGVRNGGMGSTNG